MAVPSKGTNVTVHIPNGTVTDLNPTQDHALVTLPNVPPGAEPLEFWLPLTDPRITVTQNLPANWPPQEGDVWTITIAPTLEAFVVGDGQGHFFFVLPQNIRDAYSGNTTLPASTDEALAQYGNALVLLYRRPAS
jgi:hypothetical protein